MKGAKVSINGSKLTYRQLVNGLLTEFSTEDSG